MTIKCFQGNVALNKDGEVICFCYAKDKCACLETNSCYEAVLNVELVKEIRPEEKISRDLEKVSREINKNSMHIKKGLLELEKAIRKNKNFK